ncbi:type II toxin-antitoxin system RelE/ParE family toxin [Clostridiisalibacter paucivorans]|uniref:type II toxin-antitoxin system RelE/ParE family toxin n=1 Tax=Clostridiisalibacter paucivorans TaxID=408753 RepID=UPI00047B71F1|nr:type II toxin-antitoxin system RelE/ParE family toxin [Clostridiisalibacter paucivorans]
MHKLRINPMATEDLIEIRDYITKELESPKAAINIIRKIFESYERLKEFPMMGVDLSTKINAKTDFRYLVSGNYIVFYKIDNEFVSIYRILYSRRNYLKILFPNEVDF